MEFVSTDLGLLLVRVTLGVMIALHGWNKIFGTGGISGTGSWFESLGLRPGVLYAAAAAGTEIGAGILLVIGLLQPLSSAALIGLMVVAARTDHRGKGFFVFRGGWEYVAVVGFIALALAATGPGQLSLDVALGWQWHGYYWMLGAGALGLVSASVPIAISRTALFGLRGSGRGAED